MTPAEAATDSYELMLPDEAATARLGRRLARVAVRGDVIALRGDLGAGKTTFARAFIKALAASEEEAKEEVPSPTFSLVQVYPRQPADVWHIDLYRIEHIDEILELGLDEALADGIVLIEWPERMGKLLPPDRLDLRFEFAERAQGRRVRLEPASNWRRRIREALPNE